MIRTPQRMLKQIRSETNQSEDESSYSPDVEMMTLDDAQDIVFDKIADIRPEILSTYYDLTLDGSQRYFIPDSIPFDYEQILQVEDITDSDNPYDTTSTDWFTRMNYMGSGGLEQRIAWSVLGNYLEVPRKNDTGTLRVWYTRRPVGLFYGTVAAGAASTVTFPASPTAGEVSNEDDYYNGMKIYINGPGAATGFDVRTISDYVGSTRVATVSSAFTDTPTTADTIELLSPMPERLHKLIVKVAVRLHKVGQDDDDSAIARMTREYVDDLLQRLREPNKQGPVQVRKISRFR